MRATTKKGALLFDEMNRLLIDQIAGKAATSAAIADALKIVNRVMHPYLRNRFSFVDSSDPHDRKLGILRIKIQDHAERRTASPDDLVIAFQDLQPCLS